MANAITIIAAIPIEPAPTIAIAVLDNFLPAIDKIRNPANGNAGINASKLFISHCLFDCQKKLNSSCQSI
jgi:hypothetical protein